MAEKTTADNHRVSAGPYTLELPPNGVAILYETDGSGADRRLPGGIGYLDALVQFAGEVVRLRAMVGTMLADRNEQDTAIHDAICEAAVVADELAFWKYQAIWHRAVELQHDIISLPCPEDTAAWKEAELQLQEARAIENRERAAHAEAPRAPGAT